MLGQVSLTKGRQARISLGKEDRGLTVTASLQWNGGSAERRARGADLDLHALFVPADAAVRSAGHAPGHVFPRIQRGLFRNKNRDEAKALQAELATVPMRAGSSTTRTSAASGHRRTCS